MGFLSAAGGSARTRTGRVHPDRPRRYVTPRRVAFRRMPALALSVVCLLHGPRLGAEQIGEYFRETQEIGRVDADSRRVPGLLFAVRADRGLETGAGGAVTAWRADGDAEVAFEPGHPAAKQPARLVDRIAAGRPAVGFVATQHRPGFLRSTAPVEIVPARGLTMFAVVRVTQPQLGVVMAYGSSYRSPGSLTLGVRSRLGKAVLSSYLGVPPGQAGEKNGTFLEAPAADAAGKGFLVVAVRFDPRTGVQTLYENGVDVARSERRDPLAAAQRFALGAEARGAWSFGGHLSAARAYNRALDDNEVQAVSRALMAEYGLGGKPVSTMAPLLPYAYYPSRNQMEVAIQLSPERIEQAGGRPKAVAVHVLETDSGRRVAAGTVPLDAQARGQAVFDVPDLPDGEYAVEYVIGRHVERSPETFQRIHFPFEKSRYGVTHEVYPPFEPVRVDGPTVSVVGRRYTVNDQGLFDSVISLDRELLAAPMRLVAEDADGQRLDWKPDPAGGGVRGRERHPDEALFVTRSTCPGIRLQTAMTVEEDGCARIRMTLGPGSGTPGTVRRLWLEIPLKDAEVPLFHYIADNAMRFNYGGRTPRLPAGWNGAGRIEWYREPWDGWVPIRWRASRTPSAPAGADGETLLWTSADSRQHGNQQAADHRPFVPYVWLGAEERGLAFFMENERGFETDYRRPIQHVVRRGDRVILRVEIFQSPVTLAAPRRIEFGLMASPGKPMEKGFRRRSFATGVGPVSCWGGWQCSSKYPDHRDWRVVDRIQEIRRRGAYTPEDQAWFEARYEEVKARWPGRKINGSTDWLWLTAHFARRAAGRGRTHSGVYFEEHATDVLLPEWEVFQDEWASAEFNRFRERPANWGVFSPSYHDFALYMANEWMSRGVSLYFDNTNPKRNYNERFGPAYRTPSGALVYGLSLFGQREYYRRIYKLLGEWNARGAEYPIDFTLHITNTQTLPFNTWCTATLDLEQRARTLDPEAFPPEVEGLKGGFQLPWPPDYTRTVTFGRQVGAIPVGLDFVSGHGRHHANEYTQEMMLRNWALCRIHDIRGFWLWPKTAARSRLYNDAMEAFGYGDLARNEHHSYWAEEPLIDVSRPDVKWQALTRREVVAPGQPAALLLLQSYNRTEAVEVTVSRLPLVEGILRDIERDEAIPVRGASATVPLPAPYGTRLFQMIDTRPGPGDE